MMRRNEKICLAFILIFLVSAQTVQAAGLPTFDAINAALNEVRNALMQSQFAQDIAVAMQRLEQLKATYNEMIRFNSGLDEFFQNLVGDPIKEMMRLGTLRVQDVFSDFGSITPHIEILQGSTEPQGIRQALESVTGSIPNSDARPYIPFEEMQVVSGFQFAQEIRNAGDATRDTAQTILNEINSASPKGAQKLGVEAATQNLILSQQNQEALAKLIELNATQVEQVSREEKRYEQARMHYMEEFKVALGNLENLR
jgi:hypothetical protein